MASSTHLFMFFLFFYILHWFEVYGVFDPRDYRNGLCFNPEKDHEECVPGLDWDSDCKRIHAPYPYGCYDNSCSPENEAFFLGNLLRNPDPIYSFSFQSGSGPVNPDVFKNFVRMSLAHFLDLDKTKDILQLLDPPPGSIITISTNSDGTITEDKIPRICDPKLFLYCDSSFLRYSTEKDAKSLCKCHPLYSVEVHNEDETTECNGRPGVPCQFNPNANYLSVFPGVKPEDGRKSSRCMEGTECLSFEKLKGLVPDTKEFEKQYRSGEIFHGFGYSLILTRYMLEKVTEICWCDPPKIMSVMHECLDKIGK